MACFQSGALKEATLRRWLARAICSLIVCRLLHLSYRCSASEEAFSKTALEQGRVTPPSGAVPSWPTPPLVAGSKVLVLEFTRVDSG